MVFTVRAHEWYNFTFTLAPHLRAMLLVIRSRREHALKHVVGREGMHLLWRRICVRCSSLHPYCLRRPRRPLSLACPPCHAHSCKGQIKAS